MAEKKKRSDRSSRNNEANTAQDAARSRNAILAQELADELDAHDAPDSPTGQAFIASVAASEPDKVIPSPSPADVEAGTEAGTYNAIGAEAEGLDAYSDAFTEADQAAMVALDADISRLDMETGLGNVVTNPSIDKAYLGDGEAQVTDMEASMEEDIVGAADEGISRRNPQWDQDDVQQQVQQEPAALDAPGPTQQLDAGNLTSQAEPNQAQSGSSWADFRPYSRRPSNDEVASFFRYSGGPFPSLLRSAVDANSGASQTNAAQPAGQTATNNATPDETGEALDSLDDDPGATD